MSKRELKDVLQTLDKQIAALEEEWKRNPEQGGPCIQDPELHKAVDNEIQARLRLVKLDYKRQLREVVQLLQDHLS